MSIPNCSRYIRRTIHFCLNKTSRVVNEPTLSLSSQKEDEIEEYLRKKYADESIAARHFGDGGEEMSDEITQQTLLPGVKNPNLWMVKCRIGEEKSTALLLMRKFLTYQFSGKTRTKFEGENYKMRQDT